VTARLARQRFARAAFWACILSVLALALLPVTSLQLPTTGWDKTNHALAFATLALIGIGAHPRRIRLVLASLLAFGASIEVLQSFTSYRFADWADLGADLVGLMVGSALAIVAGWCSMSRFVAPMLALPRTAKRLLAMLVDIGLCVFTVWLAVSLRMDRWMPMTDAIRLAALASVAIALPMFVVFGLYRTVFRFGGSAAFTAIWQASVLYGLLYAVVFTVLGVDEVPRSIGLLQPPLLMVALSASRAFVGHWFGGNSRGRALASNALPRVLIYGAGAAGQQLCTAVSRDARMQVAGFIDDDARLHGGVVCGLPVLDPSTLASRKRDLAVSTVLLALPSISRKRRNEILNSLRQLRVAVRTLPSLTDLAHGRVQSGDLRELDIEDLLGRDAVPPDPALLASNVRGKVVLVTGAGGSIGSELCRQIVREQPRTLLLVESTEFALYSIHGELQQLEGAAGSALRIVPLLASVRDARRMEEIISAWRPDTLYHAAAYKHVPLVEHNAAEGVKNNLLGTWVTARIAADHGVKDFVLVSTDKAVRPTNVMGASKRMSEMVLQALAHERAGQPGATRFCMVRFGNVLGSSGSVVPLFRQQIQRGGPITLTHANITRYFMTIPEAAQLVVQAGAMGTGGDVFVLDMGESVRIIDLARRMVELSGLAVRDERDPDGDIEIEITGLRPAEKLYEELLIGDNPLPTSHPRIMKAHEDFLPWHELVQRLEAMSRAVDANDLAAIRALLQRTVRGYRPADGVVDWVHMERQKPRDGRLVLASATSQEPGLA